MIKLYYTYRLIQLLKVYFKIYYFFYNRKRITVKTYIPQNEFYNIFYFKNN